ncbi:MAG: hypothetical protein INR65_13665 [Gluconacetobacter diazotrophicus]|nr:hypothetical protein [Gluconacetobacter diazotrophicus]
MFPAVDLPRRQRLAAFTLLEITIVIFLILLLLGVAVPSISGQLARRNLQGTFDRFDALAVAAQRRSVAEKRPYTLVWTRDGTVGVYPADMPADVRKKQAPAASLVPAGPATARTERYTLVRAASLTADPAGIWTFWPTGNCEPVSVRYEGPSGRWEAVYNPLSARADFKTFIAR